MKLKNSDSRFAKLVRAYMSAAGATRIGILTWLITIGLMSYWFVTGNVLLACIALISLPLSGMIFFAVGSRWTEEKERQAAEAAQGNGVLYVVSPHDGEFEPITDPNEQRLAMEVIAQYRQTFKDMDD